MAEKGIEVKGGGLTGCKENNTDSGKLSSTPRGKKALGEKQPGKKT